MRDYLEHVEEWDLYALSSPSWKCLFSPLILNAITIYKVHDMPSWSFHDINNQLLYIIAETLVIHQVRSRIIKTTPAFTVMKDALNYPNQHPLSFISPVQHFIILTRSKILSHLYCRYDSNKLHSSSTTTILLPISKSRW